MSYLKTYSIFFQNNRGPHESKDSIEWLSFARLTFVYLLLIVVIVHEVLKQRYLTQSEITIAYAIFSMCFLFNLFHALFLERVLGFWKCAFIHMFFDSLMISVWIFLSPGKDIFFAIFFLIIVLIDSLVLFQKGALFSAVLSSFFLGCTIFLHPEIEKPIGHWFLFTLLLFTLGVVGGYLSEELFRTTERLKEKQSKIEKLASLHENILFTMPTGLLTVDDKMQVHFINPAGSSILSKNRSDIMGQNLSEVEPGLMPFFTKGTIGRHESGPPNQEKEVSVSETEHYKSYFVETATSHGMTRLQQVVEFGPHRKVIRGDVAPLSSEAGIGKLLETEVPGGRVLLFQDITKLIHLEDKLKQNEKLAAVGQLAAGIAHEIRNPLTSMSASIELLKSSSLPSTDAESKKLMDITLREIDRLNHLISEFLDYVKPSNFQYEAILLGALLTEVVAAFRKQISTSITIREEYETNIQALGNASKLKQVIWNLLMNSMQAIHKSGNITVRCSNHDPYLVRFSITDDGTGMTDDVKSHLFEPFFTTKDKGTGLGLATVYKIVEAHRGEIQFQSEQKRGTEVQVILKKA